MEESSKEKTRSSLNNDANYTCNRDLRKKGAREFLYIQIQKNMITLSADDNLFTIVSNMVEKSEIVINRA